MYVALREENACSVKQLEQLLECVEFKAWMSTISLLFNDKKSKLLGLMVPPNFTWVP